MEKHPMILRCLVILLVLTMLPLCASAEGSVYRACKHKNTEIRDAGYWYGVDGCINDEQHFTEHCYEEYCFDCKKVIASGWWDSGDGNPLWEGYWEDHIFDANGECVCGYYKEPSEITEPLKVTISDWYREATVGMSIGATAKISGGSGQYTCKWVATSNQNKRAQSKPEKTTSEQVSWGITPASEGKWKITLTVQDRETGEKVSAVTRNIHVISVRDKYLSMLQNYNKYENPLNDQEIYNLVWQRLYPHFGQKRTKELIQIVSDAPADYRTLYLYTLYDYDILSTNYNESVSEYKDVDDNGTLVNGIYFKERDLNNDTVLFHEMGHAVDSVALLTLHGYPVACYASLNFKNDAGENLADETINDVEFNMINRMMDHGVSETSAQRIAKAITSGDFSELTIQERLETQNVPLYYIHDEKICTSIGDMQTGVYVPYLNVSDVYGGATDNYILGLNWLIDGSGHTKWYWKKDKENIIPGVEFWAHYFSAKMRNDQKELSAFNSMLTTACTEMDKIVEYLADELIAMK